MSIANIRSAYSEAATAMLTSDGKAVAKNGNVTVSAVANDKQSVTVENVEFQGTATGFSGLENELPFTHSLDDSSAEGGQEGKKTLTFEFGMKDNSCTLTTIA